MKTCCCTLPDLDFTACQKCSLNEFRGHLMLPVNIETHDIVIGDGIYIIKAKTYVPPTD